MHLFDCVFFAIKNIDGIVLLAYFNVYSLCQTEQKMVQTKDKDIFLKNVEKKKCVARV